MNPDKPLRKGGRFINPWPGNQQHGFRDFIRWISERHARRTIASRQISIPKRVAASFIVPRPSPQQLTATWIGHTTVLLQLGGLNILTDPIWSNRASPLSFAGPKRYSPPGLDFDSLPMIDVVVISHDHYDHLDSTTVRRLTARFPAAAWRVPLGVAAFVRKRGATDVKELSWHDIDQIGEMRLTCVPAQHFSGRSPFNRDRTLWCGWVLATTDRSVFFAGDTALNPSFADIGLRYGPFDLALMPIGAYDPRWFMRSVHMDPEECAQAAHMVIPDGSAVPCLLATHWGTFKLTDEPLDEPPRRMRTAWSNAGFPAEKLLVLSLGETRLL